MQTTEVGLAVIGGGPAGLAAALEARKNGVKSVMILERDGELGGILQQCIHNGFGLHLFGEELTGPEYAARFIEELGQTDIVCKLDTMVLDLSPERVITAVNRTDGLMKIKAAAVILAMGCRERTRGALNIPGSRPAGIYTAGAAQRLVNMEGYLPGRSFVILGSGDIGLIMARRLTLEGAKVKMVCELLPYSGGLTRNIVQCLEDFSIPLRLSHTITGIRGRGRVEGVTVARVDENRRPILSTEEFVECDTVLLSVGLIPENELSRRAGIRIDPATGGPAVNEAMETSVPGVFACGNAVQVHDLADYVTQESRRAGEAAAAYILNQETGRSEEALKTVPGGGVRYVVPQAIREGSGARLFFRVTDVCRNVQIVVKSGNKELFRAKRLRVAPGEMESLDLKSDVLAGLKEPVTVFLESAEQNKKEAGI